MKKFIYSFIAFCCISFLYSCKSTSYISYDLKTKILYRGINNEIGIKNIDCHKINISAIDATFKIKDDSTLIVNTESSGRALLILKYKNVSDTLDFHVLEFPNPILTFRATVFNSSKPMPVDFARKTYSVSSTLPNFMYDCSFDIDNFDLNVIKKDGKTRYYKIYGRDLKGIFNNAEVGDTYIFSNIKMHLIDGGDIMGTDTVIKIVENANG
ncbi:hypothetical protein ACLI09_15345 [Flavobacterium sp. RHBU_24]|uniref:hypothetical protein n=1 Tax=Flavobacterium sp. RHBU_24 TaxID=3391185 RepID=UPI0039856298